MNRELQLHHLGNNLGLLLICTLLTVALYDQWSTHDLPCPLCLLQRACFIAVGIGLCLNLKLGLHTRHYGLILFSALIGLIIAVRQISLHLDPDDPGYGNLFWGMYYYDWAAIAFCLVIAFTGLALTLEKGFVSIANQASISFYFLASVFVLLIFTNLLSTFFECGFGACVDNPVDYIIGRVG